jgi:hypothetical protein
MQREQQRIGVGEPPQPIEGERLLTIGLTGDAAGIAGHQRDEHHL